MGGQRHVCLTEQRAACLRESLKTDVKDAAARGLPRAPALSPSPPASLALALPLLVSANDLLRLSLPG